ncbi:MAG: glutamate 5-kinase, partial [Lachnospiraceae bacterium]|nr:glutamate 5-kinase [Lachnospiraceae bacterium]
MNEEIRKRIKDKKRIVIKIGSSSLQHPETGDLDYIRMEVLIRELCDLRNQGKDVVLVSSGAIAAGKKAVHIKDINKEHGENHIAVKQACAAIGQARLMMTYQKIFAEYNQVTAQILMTKNTIVDNLNRYNAHNTFSELLKMGVIPIVNENDTVATYEIEIGDNDTLSALVSSLVGADLLILLSDIDGLFTDD